jgi:biotin synthase
LTAIRAGNKDINRYRINADIIMALAENVREAGIGTVFLQGGQHPKTDNPISEVIPRIRRELDCEVLLCMGEKPLAIFEEYAALGATSYILKFEISSSTLYSEIVRTSLAKHIDCIRWIKQSGMEVGTGNIVGLPNNQTMDTLIDDVLLGEELQPDFVSVSPFPRSRSTRATG